MYSPVKCKKHGNLTQHAFYCSPKLKWFRKSLVRVRVRVSVVKWLLLLCVCLFVCLVDAPTGNAMEKLDWVLKTLAFKFLATD